jgi:hypothetical protein
MIAMIRPTHGMTRTAVSSRMSLGPGVRLSGNRDHCMWVGEKIREERIEILGPV